MRTRMAVVGLAAGVMLALSGAVSTAAAQNAEQNKALFAVIVNQVYNAGDLALADDLVAQDITNNGSPLGRDAFKAMVKDERATGAQLKVDELVSDGDRVIGRVTQTGASGDPKSQIMVLRIRDGQVTEQWTMADEPAVRQQFGLRGLTSAPATSAN